MIGFNNRKVERLTKMEKRALVASLAVVGLALTSFQGADAAIDNKESQATTVS